jgi:hypothetical protein
MYPRLRIKQQAFANNSRCIATPVLGFLSGKCHAAPITLRMIGAASFLPIYLCVSHAEALLMASNTNYVSASGMHRLLYCIHTLFVTCKRLAVLMPDLGCKGSTCSILISRSNLLWLVFVH